jgi:hypothetical protein
MTVSFGFVFGLAGWANGATADMYVNAATDGANPAMRTRKAQRANPAIVEELLSAAPATNGLNSEASTEAVMSHVTTPNDPGYALASAPPKSETPAPVEH